jgi:tetratricopeptide (TPR) repeat protein
LLDWSGFIFAKRDFQLKQGFGAALVLACLVAIAPGLRAQASKSDKSAGAGQNNGSGQSPPAANSQSTPAQAPSRTNEQNNQNPFPEDTNSVPVMPSRDSEGSVPLPDDEATHIPLPAADFDPVRSPEEAGSAAEAGQQKYSSSTAGMSDLLPPADDDNTQSGKHHRKGSDADDIVPEHRESAQEDENVGNYYLDNKDFKGALSRFESALVLDPDNPDVYWGLAECQRHLGNFAEARANYQKVMEYDPGSRHAKDARKALADPEIANAKAGSSAATAAKPQQ